MKFFGGLSAEEIAESLHVSEETVLRDWKLAKLWLLRELSAKNAMTRERRQQVEEILLSCPLWNSTLRARRPPRFGLCQRSRTAPRSGVAAGTREPCRSISGNTGPGGRRAGAGAGRARCSGRPQCRSLSDR